MSDIDSVQKKIYQEEPWKNIFEQDKKYRKNKRRQYRNFLQNTYGINLFQQTFNTYLNYFLIFVTIAVPFGLFLAFGNPQKNDDIDNLSYDQLKSQSNLDFTVNEIELSLGYEQFVNQNKEQSQKSTASNSKSDFSPNSNNSENNSENDFAVNTSNSSSLDSSSNQNLTPPSSQNSSSSSSVEPPTFTDPKEEELVIDFDNPNFNNPNSATTETKVNPCDYSDPGQFGFSSNGYCAASRNVENLNVSYRYILRNCDYYHTFDRNSMEYTAQQGACMLPEHNSDMIFAKNLFEEMEGVNYFGGSNDTSIFIELSRPAQFEDGSTADTYIQYVRFLKLRHYREEMHGSQIFSRLVCDPNNPNNYTDVSCASPARQAFWLNKNQLFETYYQNFAVQSVPYDASLEAAVGMTQHCVVNGWCPRIVPE